MIGRAATGTTVPVVPTGGIELAQLEPVNRGGAAAPTWTRSRERAGKPVEVRLDDVFAHRQRVEREVAARVADRHGHGRAERGDHDAGERRRRGRR